MLTRRILTTLAATALAACSSQPSSDTANDNIEYPMASVDENASKPSEENVLSGARDNLKEGSTPSKEQSLTGPQNNALRSARQYVEMSGFSRAGLIQQLSSDAGEGYDLSDATIAVDSLSVDWNNEAAESAQQYVSMSGFSCDGLIQQLSSSAGDKYTVSQATYGAQQAGAC